ncbi:MAG: 23S rRNA (uracil(1939)-C(5))-methyltransferase RlmD, partial [Desulfovibrionaceae bacterium]|nr:23S rRNA (uracil(1939)-C(5))-methyltransferase RlmD [Desulfovibrionaceae bacterium]
MPGSVHSSAAPSYGEPLELSIEALSSDGRGIARVQGLVVFVEGALPGQRVLANVTVRQKRFLEVELKQVLQPSGDECHPPCPHANECGGCPWQTLPYPRQLFWKQKILEDALERIGHFKKALVRPIIPSPEQWRFRNKMSFAFGLDSQNTLILGQRARHSRNVTELTSCLLTGESTMQVLSRLRTAIEESQTGSTFIPPTCWRHCVIRQNRLGNMLIELIVGKLPGAKEPCLHSLRGITQQLMQDCPQVKGVAVSQKLQGDAYARGEKTLFTMGETTLEESLRRPAALFPDSSIALRYGASSFFQVNTLAAEQLYGAGAAMLAAKPVQDLWDLYCGVGSIGLFMAPLASSLYGVECVGAAIQQARENAKGAGLARCRFEAGDASLAFRRMREA